MQYFIIYEDEVIKINNLSSNFINLLFSDKFDQTKIIKINNKNFEKSFFILALLMEFTNLFFGDLKDIDIKYFLDNFDFPDCRDLYAIMEEIIKIGIVDYIDDSILSIMYNINKISLNDKD